MVHNLGIASESLSEMSCLSSPKRPLLILMSPCLDLMVGQLSWRLEAMAVVSTSMCWSMAGMVLIWLMSGRWLSLLEIFSLYSSQLHLLRPFRVVSDVGSDVEC